MANKKEEIKGEWSYENKRYILSYTKRKPKKNEVILSPEEFIKEITNHDRFILLSIRKGEIKKDKLHLLNSTKYNLERGQMIGSKEAIIRKFQNIEEHLKNIEKIKYEVMDNLYMAIVESSQAILLKNNIHPVSPKELPKKLEKIKNPHVKKAKDIIQTFKDYEHEKKELPSGRRIDFLTRKGKVFLEETRKNE